MTASSARTYSFRVDPFDDYFFEGLGRQNMTFHHAVGELIDNAIAASSLPFVVDLHIQRLDSGNVRVIVTDHGSGISIDDLTTRALKLGGRPTSDNRLNEHGFGLKNALCSFTGNKLPFTIQTRDQHAVANGSFYEVTGPFRLEMEATERPSADWPDFGIDDTGTIVTVETSLEYFQGIQETRGPRATNMVTLRGYLAEHLGVMYRSFLGTIIPALGTAEGQIRIHQGDEVVPVRALEVPMNSPTREEIPFSAGGRNYTAIYRHGVLDDDLRDSIGFSLYYLGNIPTQGIDVRIGGRIIATRQLDEIWDIQRHNALNNFLGELAIPAAVPREYLRSNNNKSNYDLQDGIWEEIFEQLRANHEPPRDARAHTERELRQRLAENMRRYSDDEIVEEYAVWASAVKIDIYRRNPATDHITLYETKVGNAQPLNLYQLRMYWDGLVLEGQEPTEAILVVADYSDTHSQMRARINEMSDPSGRPYKMVIKRIDDF